MIVCVYALQLNIILYLNMMSTIKIIRIITTFTSRLTIIFVRRGKGAV